MKMKYLFPDRYKKIGWLIFVPTLLISIYAVVTDWEPGWLDTDVLAIFVDPILGEDKLIDIIHNNILNELLGVLLILSSLLVAFSKEKDEDEMISKIRLESLVWATYFNYAILILALILVYDVSFYWVMLFNMFTILFFFIVRFNWAIAKFRKSVSYEE